MTICRITTEWLIKQKNVNELKKTNHVKSNI
jgi:hypothetical protein